MAMRDWNAYRRQLVAAVGDFAKLSPDTVKGYVTCLLERSGGHPLRLEAGDVLLLPHGDAHVARSSARMRGPKSPIRIEYGNAIETKTNTEGKAVTELICGRLHFEAAKTVS